MSFNPLSPDAIDRTIINEFYRDQNLHALSELSPFEGEGVYFIFADSLPYEHDSTKPIYIGKAVCPGRRKGLGKGESSKALYKRLQEHSKSILSAKNLDIQNFKFKVIKIENVWISYSESSFIRHFLPIWNTGYDGFGNKKPGKNRVTQKVSQWDKAHPGRLDGLGSPTDTPVNTLDIWAPPLTEPLAALNCSACEWP